MMASDRGQVTSHVGVTTTVVPVPFSCLRVVFVYASRADGDVQASCLTGPQSFEVRFPCTYHELLASYRPTGRPPPPCPPYPPDPTARAAKGLPPFFVPAPFPGTTGPSTLAAGATSIFGNGSTLGGAAADYRPGAAAAATDVRCAGASGGRERNGEFYEYSAAAHWSHEVHARLKLFSSPSQTVDAFLCFDRIVALIQLPLRNSAFTCTACAPQSFALAPLNGGAILSALLPRRSCSSTPRTTPNAVDIRRSSSCPVCPFSAACKRNPCLKTAPLQPYPPFGAAQTQTHRN
ncbi:hypothetical protein K438DRAFT_1978496 [Mycena galopus ATCC 62051]|nr:hypothetical protein K438DRAFT_1978496 [Mycena galopus ATCC 62051]